MDNQRWDEAGPHGVAMLVPVLGLLGDVEAMRHHEEKPVLRPRHGDIEQPALHPIPDTYSMAIGLPPVGETARTYSVRALSI